MEKYDYKTHPKSFKELKKEIKRGTGLLADGLKIEWIEKIKKSFDKKTKAIFVKINGIETYVKLAEIYYEVADVIPEFQAVYNPYIRLLIVKYGNYISDHLFEDVEEWTKFDYNGNNNNPQYLHVQIDYDENFQLLFYPRTDFDQTLHEECSSPYNSENSVSENPPHVVIVHSDTQMKAWLKEFTKPEDVTSLMTPYTQNF